MIFNLSGVGTNLNWKDMVGNGFYLDPNAHYSVSTLKFVKVDDFVLIDGTVYFINDSATDFLRFSDTSLKPSSPQVIHIWTAGTSADTLHLYVDSSGIGVSSQVKWYDSTFTIHGCYYLK